MESITEIAEPDFNTDILLREFGEKEDQEIIDALDDIFEINGTKLQTDKKDGSYVFFSLTSESLKSFVNTLQTICKSILHVAKGNAYYTFRFTDKGLHKCEILENGKLFIILHLQIHFFTFYQMETGMEVEVNIDLEELLPQLTFGRRKDSCDVVYFVCSPAGIATWAMTRNPRETTPGFCGKIEKKIADKDRLSETPFIQISQPLVMFKQVSDRFVKTANSFAKDKHGQKGNLVHIRYSYPKGYLSVSTSEESFDQGKFTRFETQLVQSSLKDEKEPIQFKGTFPINVITSFCKLSSMLYLGVINQPQALFCLKAYFQELCYPNSENSYFEIHIMNEYASFA